MDELQALLNAADAADAVLKKHFQKPLAIERKADGSPVTQADKKSEKAILAVLTEAFPKYGFLSEETGQQGDQQNRWVIDPLDGTKSFIRGLPFCGPLLAFERHGVLQAGVISLPLLGQRCWAARGKGCFWNGKPCRVSQTGKLEDAFILAEVMRTAREGLGPALLELIDRCGHERGYSDCYGYFLVATGQADVFVEGFPHEWDVAAPKICIAEAGGKLTHEPGRKNGLSVATNGRLHREACSLLQKRRVK